MRIISILNFKGGTGKSSLAENLAYALVQQGKPVVVIDADRQANSSSTLLGKSVTPTLTNVLREECPLQDALFQARDNLYVIPADTDLDKASSYLVQTPEAFEVLNDSLEELQRQRSDLYAVLIDQAGAYTQVMRACLLASHEMLIPCELEPYAVAGLISMFTKLRRALGKHTIKNAGIIPYNVDMRYAMAHQYMRELHTAFGELVTAPIRTDATVPRAQSRQLTIFEYDEKSRVAEDFITLALDLIEEHETAEATR